MTFDTLIIGAGLSGLAAGIRLAHYRKRVCIVEKHTLVGGLNSYFRANGRTFDVGLHAVTNFAPPDARSAPLNRLLRQLRLRHDQFGLCPQGQSCIRFPGHDLWFTNDFERLRQEVARRFPGERDGFDALVRAVAAHDAFALETVHTSAREQLGRHIADPILRDMLLCPLMYYGNAEEHDMDFSQFCIMFRSVLQEGFSRPAEGIRRILDLLVTRYRESGGHLFMNCGVRTLKTEGNRVCRVILDDGRRVSADTVLSAAGYVETLRLCEPEPEAARTHPVGRLGYVEGIYVLDRPPAELGIDTSILFFNDRDTFTYARPNSLVNHGNGVICLPRNFRMPPRDTRESEVRLTHLANPEKWAALGADEYAAAKADTIRGQLDVLSRFVPGIRRHVVYTDLFTPRTVERYTGHINGAIYGSPVKRRDGSTPFENLYVSGTDQGFLGIVGAMLSGVSITNRYLLA